MCFTGKLHWWFNFDKVFIILYIYIFLFHFLWKGIFFSLKRKETKFPLRLEKLQIDIQITFSCSYQDKLWQRPPNYEVFFFFDMRLHVQTYIHWLTFMIFLLIFCWTLPKNQINFFVRHKMLLARALSIFLSADSKFRTRKLSISNTFIC